MKKLLVLLLLFSSQLYAYVILKTGERPSSELKNQIIETVKKKIGSHAAPETIQFTDGLPKTRSGKIMRRILRNIALGKTD